MKSKKFEGRYTVDIKEEGEEAGGEEYDQVAEETRN